MLFFYFFAQLESHKNLVDQCVQGEGLVQVNVQIKANQRRINIVDVLKPAEDYVEVAENNCKFDFKFLSSSNFVRHFFLLWGTKFLKTRNLDDFCTDFLIGFEKNVVLFS